MSGRFFATPFIAAIALWVSSDSAQRSRRIARGPLILALSLLVSFGILWPGTRWRSGINFGLNLAPSAIVAHTGIANERAYYYPDTGLLPVLFAKGRHELQNSPLPPYRGALSGARFARSTEAATIWNEVGFFGYFAGEDKMIIDVWALCDPLLARIPFRPQGPWRIGHYPRRIPEGYLRTRALDQNMLADPDLAAVWDGLTLILRGPVFSVRRWQEIWRFNTGFYARQLGKPDYR